MTGPGLHALRTGSEDAGQRLDIYLAHALPDTSRNRVQQLIREGRVRVDGRPSRTGERIRAGSLIEVEVPPPVAVSIRPEAIPLAVVFEDAELIVVDKPAGMVVHPGAGRSSGTLVNALLHHCRALSGIGGEARPGIVHRIDKGTSGLIVAAKTDRAHRRLALQFAGHTIDREYLALVWGHYRQGEGTIDRPVGRHPTDRKRMSVSSRRGRSAVTHYRVERELGPLTLLRLRLETGRTHQIRVHLSSTGHPVAGDPTYGAGASVSAREPGALRGQLRKLGRPALHAAVLGFEHPVTGERLRFEAPLPEDLRGLIRALEEPAPSRGQV